MTPCPGMDKQPCNEGFACPYLQYFNTVNGMAPYCTYPYISFNMTYAVKIYLNRKSRRFTEEGHVHNLNRKEMEKSGPVTYCPLMFLQEEDE